MAKTKIHGEYLDPSVISEQTQVTAVGADSMLIFDATDNALKKALLSDLIETVGSTPTFSSVVVDNFTLDGTTLALSGSADMTLDSGGRIILSADDNGEIRLQDGSSIFGQFKDDDDRLSIQGKIADKDMLFTVIDGSSEITALRFDASEAGKAIFNAGANFSGAVQLNDAQLNIYSSSASAIIGSIGNTANDLNIFSSSSGHNGLRFHVNGILPTDNSGTIIDNDADLGDPSYRFKNLYLGGQVNASTFVFEPTTATGLTYAADGTNSYINFEANSVADSGQLYFGQESSGGYIGIGLKHPSGSISQDVKIHHTSTLFSNRVGLNYPSELMFNGEYTIGQADIAVGAGHAARIEFLKDDFLRIQGSASVSAGASVTYTDKLKVNIDAGGILFGSDTAAANTLNDYEEGTFTPVVGNGTYTYSFRRGHYVKIGNLVHVHIGFKLNTASPSTSTARISGLPFTSASYGSYQEPHARVAVAGLCVTANLSYNLSFYINNSDTVLYARSSANNADTVVTSNNVWQNGTFIKLQMCYTVS